MQTINIGRDATNQIVLNDNYVSRQHAQLIVMDNGNVLLKDLGSANGSFVNGNKVTESYLKPGDVVKCGGAFVNWTQVVGNPAGNPNQQPGGLVNAPVEERVGVIEPTFGDIIRNLVTRIFEIDNLLRREWNRTSATLIFLITPVAVSLVISLYLSSRFGGVGFNELVLPVIGTVLLFGVAQFFSLGLLSLNREAPANRVLFAAAVYGFLQYGCFLMVLGISKSIFSFFGFSNLFVARSADFFLAKAFLGLFFLSLLVSLIFLAVVFLYKYFRSLNVSRSVSVHLTIIAFFLNLLMQLGLLYLFSAFISENLFKTF